MVRPSLAVVLLATAFGASLAADVTPIGKVLQMMEEMKAKGNAMKHEEEVEFAAFQEWCSGLRAETQKSISDGADEITQLGADISKAESDAEGLAAEVTDLNKEVDTLEGEAKSATQVRNKEQKDYRAAHLDFSESIDAIAKAISVLKSRSADVAQLLMQVHSSNMVPAKAKAVLEAFLQETAQSGAPEANAYESQSGGVIDMLEKLKMKFQDQRLVLEKEEMSAKGAYQVLNQQLTDDVKADKKAVDAKTAAKAGRLEDAAQAKGDMTVTEKTKSTDEKTLSDTNAQCTARSEEFEANQVVRRDELGAIQKAIEIISSDKVQGTAQERLPAALLQKKHSVFAQLRGEMPEARQRAIQYLQAQATKLGSRYLSVVAAHTEADPFVKVKKMIKDLITKLMEAANSEGDHNSYCNAELATNKQTREIKSSETDELSAKIDQETSSSARLSEEITNLSDALSEIKGKQSEATNLRSAEKKSNAKAVSEAKEAQSAVEQAIKVLKDFYESQASAAMVQTVSKDIESMKEPYKGMGASSGGIVGMLEVVLSDFARLDTETSENEAQGQRAYDKFMDESTEDAAVKETEKKHKENNRDRADEKNRGFKKELELTQGELDSAMDYYDKLKTQCVETKLSYGDRKKMREEEIASLSEALKILTGEDI